MPILVNDVGPEHLHARGPHRDLYDHGGVSGALLAVQGPCVLMPAEVAAGVGEMATLPQQVNAYRLGADAHALATR